MSQPNVKGKPPSTKSTPPSKIPTQDRKRQRANSSPQAKANEEQILLTPSLMRQIMREEMEEMKQDIQEVKEELQIVKDEMRQDMKDVKEEIQTVKDEMEHMKSTMDMYATQSDKAMEKATETNDTIEKLQAKVEDLEMELENEKEKRLKVEYQQKKRNLIFTNVKEKEEERKNNKISKDIVADILYNTLKIDNVYIEKCHRIGRYKDPQKQQDGKTGKEQSRPLFVQFATEKDRDEVWRNRRELKGKHIIMKEDLPEEYEKRAAKMIPVMQAARTQGMKANIVQDKLVINNEWYNHKTLNRLPSSLKLERLSTKSDEKSLMFYGRHSVFSNFYQRENLITDEGKTYTSVEQFFHYKKAEMFEDEEAMTKIMRAKDPVEQKNITVKGFKKETWRKNCRKIMKEGRSRKYRQHPDLAKALLDTKNKLIVEANPHDHYWGIGLSFNDKKINQMHLWGKNVLGEILMELRTEMS